MTPDPSFVRDLHGYDPKLTCRWARHQETWFIEREVDERNPGWRAERPLNPFGTSKRAKDLWEGWRLGRVHVLTVHPSMLHWSLVAPHLSGADSFRAGSFTKLADEMDAVDAKIDAARTQTVANWSESAASSAADHLYWQQGHTVATAHEESGVIPSDTVERHPDGFVIRTRKGGHGAA